MGHAPFMEFPRAPEAVPRVSSDGAASLHKFDALGTMAGRMARQYGVNFASYEREGKMTT